MEGKPGAVPAWVSLVKDYLHTHWDKNITLKELSLAANVHPVTISKYFHKYFSCTLGTYMRKLKVEKALSIIKSGNSSLAATAYECAFSDQSHFIRTFKQMTGFLPAIYQKL